MKLPRVWKGTKAETRLGGVVTNPGRGSSALCDRVESRTFLICGEFAERQRHRILLENSGEVNFVSYETFRKLKNLRWFMNEVKSVAGALITSIDYILNHIY